jgi:CHAD domain-containing protein
MTDVDERRPPGGVARVARVDDSVPVLEDAAVAGSAAPAAGAAVDGSAEVAGSTAPSPPPLPTLGQPPGPIEPDDSFSVAGRKAMWPHVRRLLDLDAALRDPDRPHDLKRYRVATRRLRAALRAFDAAFPRRDVRDLREDLGDLATVAGAARDLDVRIADLSQWAFERGGEAPAGVRPLVAAWQVERAAALSHLEARLATRRHRRLLEDLVAFVEDRAATARRACAAPARRAGAAPARPIGLRAGSLVWESYEQLVAYDRGIRWADLETMHQLRIEAKRLRYLLEFLGEILGSERTELIGRLVAVQDQLGLLNDAAVTSAAVRAFLQEAAVPLGVVERAEISAYLTERERETVRARRGATRPWRAVAGVTFSRRLARTLPTTKRPALLSTSGPAASAARPSATRPSTTRPSATPSAPSA